MPATGYVVVSEILNQFNNLGDSIEISIAVICRVRHLCMTFVFPDETQRVTFIAETFGTLNAFEGLCHFKKYRPLSSSEKLFLAKDVGMPHRLPKLLESGTLNAYEGPCHFEKHCPPPSSEKLLKCLIDCPCGEYGFKSDTLRRRSNFDDLRQFV
ncbi:hypothetical protein CDAR_63611 [Caerostris darwini]|uniref:Uncharacterized protein n=1 Tax=Caerostris darwini TaxID=1538125 RepID=A0AAV4QIH5_9ARAC|nr:hypothetical protein CDAR_63611 [Caerostris darwini]